MEKTQVILLNDLLTEIQLVKAQLVLAEGRILHLEKEVSELKHFGVLESIQLTKKVPELPEWVKNGK